MYTDQLFDWLPFWALFVGTIVVVLLSLDVGFRLGRRERRRPAPDGETPAASTAAATLGLLALMLGFTFGMAVSRFDARKQLVLDEANAIGTAYLRAELLPQPYGADIQRLLREYMEVRLEGIHRGDSKARWPDRRRCTISCGRRRSSSGSSIPARWWPASLSTH